MSVRRIETRVVTGLLAAFTGDGETLYQRDGITLEGTVRMVTRGAAVCHVLLKPACGAAPGSAVEPPHVQRLPGVSVGCHIGVAATPAAPLPRARRS